MTVLNERRSDNKRRGASVRRVGKAQMRRHREGRWGLRRRRVCPKTGVRIVEITNIYFFRVNVPFILLLFCRSFYQIL